MTLVQLTDNNKTVDLTPTLKTNLDPYSGYISERTWRQAHRENDGFDFIRGVKRSYTRHPNELGTIADATLRIISGIVWGCIGLALIVLWFFPGLPLCGTIILRTAANYTVAFWLALFNGVPPPCTDRMQYWIEMWLRGLKDIKDACFTNNPTPAPLFRPPITAREAIRETILAILFWGGSIVMTIMMQFIWDMYRYFHHWLFG